MCLVIIFLFLWFHHGCFTEHMIGEEITKELNKTPAVIVRIEGGEILVEDADKFKQLFISNKVDDVKDEIVEDETLGDKIKSTASSIASTASDVVSSVASTASNAVSTVASPIARFGTLIIRFTATSSLLFRMTRRYARISRISRLA